MWNSRYLKGKPLQNTLEKTFSILDTKTIDLREEIQPYLPIHCTVLISSVAKDTYISILYRDSQGIVFSEDDYLVEKGSQGVIKIDTVQNTVLRITGKCILTINFKYV